MLCHSIEQTCWKFNLKNGRNDVSIGLLLQCQISIVFSAHINQHTNCLSFVQVFPNGGNNSGEVSYRLKVESPSESLFSIEEQARQLLHPQNIKITSGSLYK
jgi:hypothetical protein